MVKQEQKQYSNPKADKRREEGQPSHAFGLLDSRNQIDAATITPAAKPASERCTILLSDFFIKNTHAEPSVVPIKGISIPIKVSITSSSLYKKFVSCQLNYTTMIGIMIAEAEISLGLYHLLFCVGVYAACIISVSINLQKAYSTLRT